MSSAIGDAKMRKRLLGLFDIQYIDIYHHKGGGYAGTIFELRRHPPTQREHGLATEYELSYLRNVLYVSIVK